MKFNHFQFIFLVLFFITKTVNGNNKNIYLHGKIDTSLINKFGSNKLKIKINETTNPFNDGRVIEVPFKSDGSYDVNINTNESIIYMSFWMMDNRSNIPNLKSVFGKFPNLEDSYLFENGDSIEFRMFKGGSFYFKGKGSEKLMCQSQIYNFDEPYKLHPRLFELDNLSDFSSEYILKDKLSELTMEMKFAVLKSYRKVLGDPIYNRLYLDVIGRVGYDIQHQLPISLSGSDSLFLKRKMYISQYYQSTLNKGIINEIDSGYMAESAYYPEMLFMREFNSLRLFSENPMTGNSFKEIYERLKNKYRGKLRDKLLLICYQQLIRYYSEEAKIFLKDALETVQYQRYRNLLQEWGDKQNQPAYAFELQDINGKVHKLNDYKGKILVIDFWFTGCTWCTYLNIAMQTIIQRYKSNKDVVFLTISTDGNKDQWIKSIKTGKYTSPETIDLYTGGQGEQHPIIKYYNFIGAPQQVMIDKEGRLISSAPPRPDSNIQFETDKKTGNLKSDSEAVLASSSAKAFMKLIDDNLSKFSF